LVKQNIQFLPKTDNQANELKERQNEDFYGNIKLIFYDKGWNAKYLK
jgi:hypothetical protein